MRQVRERIADGEVWKTYVLVPNHNPDNFFAMNIDPRKIRKLHDNMAKTTHVEIWTYYRDKDGDVLMSKEYNPANTGQQRRSRHEA